MPSLFRNFLDALLSFSFSLIFLFLSFSFSCLFFLDRFLFRCLFFYLFLILASIIVHLFFFLSTLSLVFHMLASCFFFVFFCLLPLMFWSASLCVHLLHGILSILPSLSPSTSSVSFPAMSSSFFGSFSSFRFLLFCLIFCFVLHLSLLSIFLFCFASPFFLWLFLLPLLLMFCVFPFLSLTLVPDPSPSVVLRLFIVRRRLYLCHWLLIRRRRRRCHLLPVILLYCCLCLASPSALATPATLRLLFGRHSSRYGHSLATLRPFRLFLGYCSSIIISVPSLVCL